MSNPQGVRKYATPWIIIIQINFYKLKLYAAKIDKREPHISQSTEVQGEAAKAGKEPPTANNTLCIHISIVLYVS